MHFLGHIPWRGLQYLAWSWKVSIFRSTQRCEHFLTRQLIPYQFYMSRNPDPSCPHVPLKVAYDAITKHSDKTQRVIYARTCVRSRQFEIRAICHVIMMIIIALYLRFMFRVLSDATRKLGRVNAILWWDIPSAATWRKDLPRLTLYSGCSLLSELLLLLTLLHVRWDCAYHLHR